MLIVFYESVLNFIVGIMIDMELSDEKENFAKIANIVLDIVPKYLRKCFIAQWDTKYPNQTWQSGQASGQFLFNELPTNVKNNGKNTPYIDNLSTGVEENWDTTTLVFAFLYSGLALVPKCRGKSNRIHPLLDSEEIDVIREIRNSAFAHASTMSCPGPDFTKIMTDIKSVARNIFGKDAEDEIVKIETSQIEAKIAKQLRSRLDTEIKRNQDFDILVKDLEGRFSQTMFSELPNVWSTNYAWVPICQRVDPILTYDSYSAIP